jgi:hypothetical protein
LSAVALATKPPPHRPRLVPNPVADSELLSPITTEQELVSVMRAYRQKRDLSCLAADYIAGLPDGYTQKLETGVRRWFPTEPETLAQPYKSWWWSLGALRLAMILVPITSTIRADKCPCCGATKS